MLMAGNTVELREPDLIEEPASSAEAEGSRRVRVTAAPRASCNNEKTPWIQGICGNPTEVEVGQSPIRI